MKVFLTLATLLALPLLATEARAACSYQQLQYGCYNVNDLVGHEDGSSSYMCICPYGLLASTPGEEAKPEAAQPVGQGVAR